MSVITILASIQFYLTNALGALLVVGVIGNILNCLVFLRKRLRSNPCSVNFAAASIANAIVMTYFIVPTIYSVYNTPPENSNWIYCKLRLYIRNALSVISRSYLSLACVACYAQSSRNAKIRGFCQPKIVRRIMIIVPIIWLIIPLHIPLTTTIQNGKCSMWAGTAALYHSIYICFVTAILPTSIMIIFSLSAFNNLRQMKRNIRPTGQNIEEGPGPNAEKMRLQKRDRQLSKMLFVQIVVYMVFNIAYPVNTLYNAIILIIGGSKSAERTAIENFILFIISSFLSNFYSSASFFVFLTSGAFRTELRQVLTLVLPKGLVVVNRRHTTNTTAFA